MRMKSDDEKLELQDLVSAMAQQILHIKGATSPVYMAGDQFDELSAAFHEACSSSATYKFWEAEGATYAKEVQDKTLVGAVYKREHGGWVRKVFNHYQGLNPASVCAQVLDAQFDAYLARKIVE